MCGVTESHAIESPGGVYCVIDVEFCNYDLER